MVYTLTKLLELLLTNPVIFFPLSPFILNISPVDLDFFVCYLVAFHTQRPLLRAAGNQTLQVDINSFLDAFHESPRLGCTLALAHFFRI